MRRLLLLAFTPLLVSAADPLRMAQREAAAAAAEQRQLEGAVQAARGEAQAAAARRAAEAQAMLATDARIALAEVQLAALAQRRAVLESRLAQARRPATALLAGLAEAGRRPAWLILANADGADALVRFSALVRALGPEVERRSAVLRGEAEILAATAAAQQALRQRLGKERQAAADAQVRFAAREGEALGEAKRNETAAVVAGDQVLSGRERLALLTDAAAQRRSARVLAIELARLAPAAPRPIAADQRAASPPLGWSLPAGGPIATGMGELGRNGVRARGLTIAAQAGTSVVAPAAGRIAFAGPFRRRTGVVIIDHGGGWATLMTEVRPQVRVGERVMRSQAIGRALGPVTAELFRNGTAEPAALLARS